jgi:hypothetical protein
MMSTAPISWRWQHEAPEGAGFWGEPKIELIATGWHRGGQNPREARQGLAESRWALDLVTAITRKAERPGRQEVPKGRRPET